MSNNMYTRPCNKAIHQSPLSTILYGSAYMGGGLVCTERCCPTLCLSGSFKSREFKITRGPTEFSNRNAVLEEMLTMGFQSSYTTKPMLGFS